MDRSRYCEEERDPKENAAVRITPTGDLRYTLFAVLDLRPRFVTSDRAAWMKAVTSCFK